MAAVLNGTNWDLETSPLFLKGRKEGIIAFATAIVLPTGNIFPPSAALFGGVYSIMYTILKPGVHEHFSEGDDTPSKVYVFVVTYLLAAALAVATVKFVHLPISLLKVPFLSVMMFSTRYVVDYIIAWYNSSKK